MLSAQMGGYSSSQAKEMAYNSLDSTFEHELMWQFTEWSAVEEKTVSISGLLPAKKAL